MDNIQEESELLQRYLNNTLDLLAEARKKATELPDSALDEASNSLSSIIEICEQGEATLKLSLDKISFIQQILIGSQVDNYQQSSSDSIDNKKSGRVFDELIKTTKDGLNKCVSGCIMATSLMTGLLVKVNTQVLTLAPSAMIETAKFLEKSQSNLIKTSKAVETITDKSSNFIDVVIDKSGIENDNLNKLNAGIKSLHNNLKNVNNANDVTIKEQENSIGYMQDIAKKFSKKEEEEREERNKELETSIRVSREVAETPSLIV